jgi:hypothetical protein
MPSSRTRPRWATAEGRRTRGVSPLRVTPSFAHSGAQDASNEHLPVVPTAAFIAPNRPLSLSFTRAPAPGAPDQCSPVAPAAQYRRGLTSVAM